MSLIIDDSETGILVEQSSSTDKVLDVYNHIIRYMDPDATVYLKHLGAGGIGLGESDNTKMFVLKHSGYWALLPTASARRRLSLPDGNRTLNVLKALIPEGVSQDGCNPNPEDPKFELIRSSDGEWRIKASGNWASTGK